MKSDLKIIGEIKYVPVLILLLTCVFTLLFKNNIQVYGLSLEIMIPCLGIWWSGYYLAEHIGEIATRELIYSLRKGVKRYLIAKYCLYSLVWIILGGMFTAGIMYRNSNLIYYKLLAVIVMKSIFLSSVVFVIVAFIGDASWAMIAIAALICVDYCFGGELLGKINLALYWYYNAEKIDSINEIIVPLVCSGGAMIVGAKRM